MKAFSGIPASPGIAIGKAVYFNDEMPEIPHYNAAQAQLPGEWERLEKAISLAKAEINSLCGYTKDRNQADIFQAQIMMLEDPDYLDSLREYLYKTCKNVEWVVNEVCGHWCKKLDDLQDAAFRQRSADILDISRRIIKNLLGNSLNGNHLSLKDVHEDIILVASDLLPSDAILMDSPNVKGLVMDGGSSTSHTAILARAFNVPAVLGLSVISKEVKNGQILAINGSTGLVQINPDKETLARHEKELKKCKKQRKKLSFLQNLPAETIDGHRVKLKANIGFPAEAGLALQFGAEGIGLYRSEFLFISPQAALSGASDEPAGEEPQFNAYAQVLKTMAGLPVTIRTADLGGDKFFGAEAAGEKNPLLGCRAIRLSLSNPQMFKAQLRAILRAGVYGNVRIMFPMISDIEELEQALTLLEEARTECREKKQGIAETIETGIMIEVPSAAVCAGILAKKSDFFSIGTNDLVQYTFAADRGSEKTSHLASPYHPAVLGLIKQTIDAAHNAGIKAAMCGEFAGDPGAAALLLGLGLDEFSMNVSSIPKVKQIIRSVSFETCKTLAGECLAAGSGREIKAAINNFAEGKSETARF